ncbi:hypothetical protein DYB31_012867 [Aphanomyces astaci]|uniref:tRNA-intron lyase n=1 Tax=Aphanomyces astaci TaxID=112090 RepID=A0A397F1U5_APHAT|nr:hypothetical protein DYB31_012867 [Aphanomyces astaci]
MLYGVTYVLYRMSPDVVHSEYMMLTRLAEVVKKTVLVCEVQLVAKDDSADPAASISIAGRRFHCREMAFRHWPARLTEGASFAMAESTAIPKRTRS